MSVMLIDPEIICAAIRTHKQPKFYSNDNSGDIKPLKWFIAGNLDWVYQFKTHDYYEQIEKFYIEIYKLNIKTWNRKYGKETDMDFYIDFVKTKHVHLKPALSDCQFIKTLEFIGYQIESGYLDEDDKIHLKKLQKIIDGLKNWYMSNFVREYRNAKWGIPETA